MRIVRFAVLVAVLALPAVAHERGFNYIYSRGGKSVTMGGNFDDLIRITKRYSGKYLWVSRGDDSYVIRDAATLAEVDRAFAPLQSLETQLERLEARMDPLEDEEEKLEDRIDAIEEELEDDDEELPDTRRRQLERDMRALEREMRTLEQKMRDLEREERDLDRLEDEREREAERELWRIVERAIRSGAAQKE